MTGVQTVHQTGTSTRNYLLIFLLCLSIASACAVHVRAGTSEWISRGPYAGDINCIAVDPVTPSTIYAGNHNGLFRSVDAGKTWKNMDIQPKISGLEALAVDPEAPETIYASTSDGLYKSIDGGLTWNNLGYTYTGQILVLDPSASSTLYAGSEKIYKSTDGGSSWQQIGMALPLVGFNTMLIDPNDSRILYLSANSNQDGPGMIFKSTDGGTTWSEIMAGQGNTKVDCLAMNPSTPATLYAGTSNGVLKSTDGGAEWVASSTGLQAEIDSLAVDPANPDEVLAACYLGIYRSENGGVSWSLASRRFAQAFVSQLAYAPSSGHGAYAATFYQGVLTSSDDGATWNSTGPGLGYASINDILMVPGEAGTVYAATEYNGVEKSLDGGDTWSPASRGLSSCQVNALASDPSSPSTIYAATHAGIAKTADGGETWQPADSGITGFMDAVALAVDPSDPSNVFAGSGSNDGIYKSIDGGLSWSQVGGPLAGDAINALVIDPSNTATVYAVDSSSGQIFKSVDAGSTWSPCRAGLAGEFINTVVLDPADPCVLFAGGRTNVFRSSDGGATWSPTTLKNALGGFDLVTLAFAFDPANHALYSVTDYSSVYRSLDDGNTWIPVTAGFAGQEITGIAVDPSDSNHLLAGTFGGVYSAEYTCPTLVISPSVLPDATSWIQYSQPLSTQGGVPPYTYRLMTADLPISLTVSPDGTVSCMPTTGPSMISFLVRSTDALGCQTMQDVTISVRCPDVSIGPDTLPPATAGTYYSQQFTVNGEPVHGNAFSVGGDLPQGVEFNWIDDELEGTPAGAGTFAVRADIEGVSGFCDVTKNYTLVVNPVCPMTLSPGSLQDAIPGVPYSQSFEAAGGTPPYTYAVSSGSLPGGLSLSPDGLLSGTVSARGYWRFRVAVADATQCMVTKPYSIYSGCDGITFSPETLPAATIRQYYDQPVTVNGPGGPYEYQVVDGTLPPVLRFSGDDLSGIPYTPGTYTFTLALYGATNHCPGTKTYTLSVQCTPVEILPTSLPNPQAGRPYTQFMSAGGGLAPYSYALTDGTLPQGISFNDGVLSGSPTRGGSFSFTLTATDAAGCSGSRNYTVETVAITAAVRKPNPFRIAIMGSGFQDGCTATIDGTPVTVKFKNGSKIVLKHCKKLCPKGQPVVIVIVNPNGATGQVPFTR